MLQFVELKQELPVKRSTSKRKEDFNEIYNEYITDKAKDQSSRCSQCGVPFCQIHCPLSNNIPDWLKLTAEGRLKEAYEISQSTNNNFLKNVFLVEKFADKNGAKVLHCFAQDKYKIPNADVYTTETLKTVWPEWSKDRSKQSKRQHISEPSLAKDGIHYGVEHHNAFGKQIYYTFRTKLK